MKLLGRNKAPERLRASVDAAGGSVEMRVSAILRPLGFNSTAPLAVAAREQVLERAGLVATPPIAGTGWDDAVTVSVPDLTPEGQAAPAAEEIAEPEGEVGVEQSAAIEPEADVEEETIEDPGQNDAVVATAAEIVAEEDDVQAERQRELERRLQALVERERGASEQAQAEAERRIAEAAQVLDEVRRASEIELERR